MLNATGSRAIYSQNLALTRQPINPTINIPSRTENEKQANLENARESALTGPRTVSGEEHPTLLCGQTCRSHN